MAIDRELIRAEDLIKELGISRQIFNRDLRFLQIEVQKDEGGRAYLSQDQAGQIRALRQYVGATGKRKGFENIAVEDENEARQNSGELVKFETDNLNTSQPEVKTNPQAATSKQHNQEQLAALVRSAQELAAGMEIARYTLASQIQENPDALLPEDLKAQVNSVRSACAPKSQDPMEIASQFLADYQNLYQDL